MGEKKKIDWKFLNRIEKILNENGPTITMCGAVILLGVALFSGFKASHEVSDIQDKFEDDFSKLDISDENYEKELKDLKANRNIRYVLAYKYALLFGIGSAGLTFLSNYLNGVIISGLAATAALNQEKIKKLVDNGKNLIGEEKFKEIEDKSLEDLVSSNFSNGDQPVARKVTNKYGELFIDTDSGVMLQIDRKDLEEVLKRAEEYCARNHELYRDKFFDMLGYEPPTGSHVNCWGPNNPFKAHIGNRNLLGAVVPSIEYENGSTSPRCAGIPGSKY